MDSLNRRGGAAVNALNRMEPWEAHLVLNLRLWCDGARGQSQVWTEYCNAFREPEARLECEAFERLVQVMINRADRPLVRHDIGCSCVGSDEAVFVNFVRTASEGHLTDAALIATLLVGPAHAEHVAMLAGQVGSCVQRIHDRQPQPMPSPAPRHLH